jgi:hypothetical protein
LTQRGKGAPAAEVFTLLPESRKRLKNAFAGSAKSFLVQKNRIHAQESSFAGRAKSFFIQKNCFHV